MPIYEYQCSLCQREFELRRSYQEMDAPAQCPTCGGQGNRLVSAFAAKSGGYLRPAESPPLRKPVQEKQPSKPRRPRRSARA